MNKDMRSLWLYQTVPHERNFRRSPDSLCPTFDSQKFAAQFLIFKLISSSNDSLNLVKDILFIIVELCFDCFGIIPAFIVVND